MTPFHDSQKKISLYQQGDQAAGFRLGNILADSVLRKMGLRSRDVITAVNDETITDPDQAASLFEKLLEGGDITVKIKRRRCTRQIRLNIE